MFKVFLKPEFFLNFSKGCCVSSSITRACVSRFYYILYQYLNDQKTHYTKQFGFQAAFSTEHSIVNLADEINESFEKIHYTPGVLYTYLKVLILWTVLFY